MKFFNLNQFVIFITVISLYTTSQSAMVSVDTSSFLPFSIEAVYLNEYPFKQDLINEAEIPAGKYRVQYKHHRNQQMIETKQWLLVKELPNDELQKFSLVILPSGEVIDTTDFKVTSPEMFPEIRFAARAKKSYLLLQDKQMQRDQFGGILPNIDEYHTTELEKNYNWYNVNSNSARDPTYCTGSFKINPNDDLPYFTTANSDINFDYRQANQNQSALNKVHNDQTVPVKSRQIHATTDYKQGLKFDLYINKINKTKTQAISTKDSIYNYKAHVKLYMTANQRKPMLLINHPMYYQENCSSQNQFSFLYYKSLWTRFWDYILPDISWK